MSFISGNRCSLTDLPDRLAHTEVMSSHQDRHLGAWPISASLWEVGLG